MATINWTLQHWTQDAADWTADNPTLLEGQFGHEGDTGLIKIGDGTTAWNSLAYISPAGAALTKVDDTNVTLTLGGSPTTALLAATSLTLGWTGTLATSRGGTNQNSSASTGVAQVSAGTWSFSTALANGTTATTQAANDNSTKVATTAYVDTAAGAPADMDFVLVNSFKYLTGN